MITMAAKPSLVMHPGDHISAATRALEERKEKSLPLGVVTGPSVPRGSPSSALTTASKLQPRPYRLGAAEDEDGVAFIERLLSQDRTGLGVRQLPSGAAVNPVHHLAIRVHQLIAHQ